MNLESTLADLVENEVIGPHQAQVFDEQGFRTLGDLSAALESGADLTEFKWIGDGTVDALRAAISEVTQEAAETENEDEAAAEDEEDRALEQLAEVLVIHYPEEIKHLGGTPVEVATEILRSASYDMPDGGVGAVTYGRPVGPLRWDRPKLAKILGLDREWGNYLPHESPPLGHNVKGYLRGLLDGTEDEDELAVKCGFRDRNHARHVCEEEVFKLFENFALVKARPIIVNDPRPA